MIPELVLNYVNGRILPAKSERLFSKLSPHSGREICKVARSGKPDVRLAIEAASKAQPAWAELTPIARGDLMRDVACIYLACIYLECVYLERITYGTCILS